MTPQPDVPSDFALIEQAYLIERGVRCLALLDACPSGDVGVVRHKLATVTARGNALPFVLADGRRCGFASHAWVVDLLKWADAAAPVVQRDRIIGLLLGYSPEAIRRFDELGSTLGPDSEDDAVDAFDRDRRSSSTRRRVVG